MKIRILLLSFFIFIFCGCKGKEPPCPVTEFSADMVISVDDSLQSREELLAHAVSAARGVLCVTLTHPPEVSDLCYKWGDGFEMTYNGLKVLAEADYLPEFSFARVLYEVLENLRENPQCTGFEQEVATFEGRVTAGEYCAETDKAGNVQQISVGEINLTIEFSYKE